jgi:tetratricopeptide (TPR) repeat protein
MRLLSTNGTVLSSVILAALFQAGCQRSADYYVRKGGQYFAEGKYTDASINYRKGVQANPNSAEAHYRLALAEEKQGSANVPYDELRRAVELAPGRDDIRIELADVSLSAYQSSANKPKVLYDQVAATADRLLKKDPNSFDGLRLRADVLALDRRFDEALATYWKANSQRPLDPKVILPMVEVLLLLNQPHEAEDLAKRCLKTHTQIGALYDVLGAHYTQAKRTDDAEALLKTKVANMPQDSRAVVELASFYWQFRREAEMNQTLKRLLDDPKDFPEARAIRGDFYVGIGKPDQARQELEAGLASTTKNKALYQKKIAKVLISQGKGEEAIQQLEQVLKTNPDDMDSREARAILLMDSNDRAKLDLAISELRAIAAGAPKNASVRYSLGMAYLKKGDTKDGRARLEESANLLRDYLPPRLALAEESQKERDYSGTIRIAEEILAIEPANADAKLWHAAGLIGTKSYAQAREELDALLREHPDSPNVNLHLAVLDTDQRRFQEAESRYRKLYQPGDRDIRPLEGLVQLYSVEKQLGKAQTLLEQELAQRPGSRPVRLLLGAVTTREGKLDLAMQQYEWLRANDPKDVEAYTAVGNLYQLQGDWSRALENYNKARALAPYDSEIIARIAFLEGRAGQEQSSIQDLRKQLALDPGNVIAMNDLAFTLAEAGNDLDQALTLAQNAQRKAPNNPSIADTLGWVYAKKGLNDSAIQVFQGLVDKYPNSAILRYHLGVALLQKGEPTKAKSEFLAGLSKKPTKELADKIKKLIAQMG